MASAKKAKFLNFLLELNEAKRGDWVHYGGCEGQFKSSIKS